MLTLRSLHEVQEKEKQNMSYEEEELWDLEDCDLDIELLKVRMRMLDKIQRDIRRRKQIILKEG